MTMRQISTTYQRSTAEQVRLLAVVLAIVALAPCLWSVGQIVQSTMDRKLVADWVVLVSGVSATLLVAAMVMLIGLKPVQPKPCTGSGCQHDDVQADTAGANVD